MTDTKSMTKSNGNDRLAVAPPFYPITRSNDTIQFRSGPWAGPVVTLSDEDGDGRLAELPPLLDGRLTVRELLERFDPSDRTELATVLEALQEQGVLTQIGHPGVEPLSGYQAVDPTTDSAGVADSTAVLVVCTGRIGPMVADDLARLPLDGVTLLLQNESGAAGLTNGLSESVEVLAGHVDPADVLSDIDYLVYTTDRPGYEFGRRINEVAFDHEIPWISARLSGLDGQVGPTVIPGRSACYECLYRRVSGTMDDPNAHRDLTDVEAISAPLRSHARILAGWLVTDFLRLISNGSGFTLGGLVHFDFFDMTVEPNPVLKVPRCPTCGSAGNRTLDVKRFVDFDTVIEETR